jgi:hypothetical protein
VEARAVSTCLEWVFHLPNLKSKSCCPSLSAACLGVAAVSRIVAKDAKVLSVLASFIIGFILTIEEVVIPPRRMRCTTTCTSSRTA